MEENKKLTKKENIIQMIKFLLFSISAGVIQLGTFSILFSLLKLEEWIAYLISLVLSVLWNFTLNREFTFKSAANVPVAMLKVALFYVIFTPLSTWWMNYFTDHNVNGYLVEGLTMVLNFVLEFLYCKFFVYRNSINTKQSKNNK